MGADAGLWTGSHKKRDYRCWASAPPLDHGRSPSLSQPRSSFLFLADITGTARTQAFTQALEREGFDVHHQLEDPSLSGPPLEADPALTPLASDEERSAEVRRKLEQAAEQRRALILFCSHVGQHKFAGNVIVRPPTLAPYQFTYSWKSERC